jgi:hypothetical protein
MMMTFIINLLVANAREINESELRLASHRMFEKAIGMLILLRLSRACSEATIDPREAANEIRAMVEKRSNSSSTRPSLNAKL